MAGEESFLDLGVNLDDVPDLTTVPAGEYEVAISDMGTTTTEKGKYLIVRMEHTKAGSFRDITAPLRVPEESMNDKDKARYQRQHKAFRHCFGIPTAGPLVYNDHIGKRGWVTLDESDDPKYGKQNNVRQWLAKR